MNKQLINILLSSFLLGCLLGILVGISIKYPARETTFTALSSLCEDHKGWEVAMIGITGKIYTVTCKDGVELNLTKIPQVQQQLPSQEPQK